MGFELFSMKIVVLLKNKKTNQYFSKYKKEGWFVVRLTLEYMCFTQQIMLYCLVHVYYVIFIIYDKYTNLYLVRVFHP